MKYLIFPILFVSFFFFACTKSTPETAHTDELSSLNYAGKIYTQPIENDNHIFALVNESSSTYLAAYGHDGDNNWNVNVNEHMIAGITAEDVTQLWLQKSAHGDLLMNMINIDNNEELVKSVRFNNLGSFQNEFRDTIHQTDTIFHQLDTLPLQRPSSFKVNGIVPLSDGGSAVISSWLPIARADTTFIQMSRYNSSGYHYSDIYYVLNESVAILSVNVSSNNSLVLQTGNGNIRKFSIINTSIDTIYTTGEMYLYDIFSFYENSSGDFIFTGSTLNNTNTLESLGVVLSISSQGEYRWHKVFQNNIAWMFMSVTEISDGYLFTGFETKDLVIEAFDWRFSFNNEDVSAIVLKTDFQGNAVWPSNLQINASSVGAIILDNETLTFFGGKYDRTLHSTIILKLNQEGEIIN